jgi:hypothetical protein
MNESNRNRDIFFIQLSFHMWKLIGTLVGFSSVLVYFYFKPLATSAPLMELAAWSIGLALVGLLIGSIVDMTQSGNPKASQDPGTVDPKMAYDKADTGSSGDFGGAGE